MDLAAAILEDHSRARTNAIAAWVGRDARRFAQLFALVKTGTPRLRQCAAWSMTRCLQHHPDLITPWMEDALDLAVDPSAHPAVRRNIYQALQTAPWPDSVHDRLFQLASGAVTMPDEAAAVKAYAITLLKRLTTLYPELLPEARRMVREACPGAPAAVLSRAKKEFGISRREK
jgi:hypothetical protein